MRNILEKRNRASLQMHSLARYFLAFCWLAFFSAAVAHAREADTEIGQISGKPAEAALISGPVKFDVRVTTFTDKEYAPDIAADSYTWKEESLYVQTQVFIRPRAYVSLGWLDSSIEQENEVYVDEVYGDIDFRLKNRAPILGFGLPIGSVVNIRGQVSPEKYTNASTDAFYQLEEPKTLVTGYFETSLTAGNMWAAISFNRQRDTDPVYDEVTDRAQMNINAKELSGLAVSWRVNPQFELGTSIYYEQYETALADQLNANAEMAYNPAWSKALSFSLGGGYYTEEKETLLNMTSGYFTMVGALDLSVEWQVEFSDNEQSLLNQVRAYMKYYAGKYVSCYIQGEYGRESGDDKDIFSTFNAGLEAVF